MPAVLLAGCSATLQFGDGAYANCVDLGDLALTAGSRADAEQRMTAQVLDLGGDTLLFGERPRAASGTVPEEITERRNQLTSAAADADRPSIVEVSPDVIANPPDERARETAEYGDEPSQPVDRGRPRRGSVSVEPVAAAPGESWYYGAALRCRNAKDVAMLREGG